MELYSAKQPGTPLRHSEILAFATLYQLQLAAWEVSLFLQLDRIALQGEWERAKRKQNGDANLIDARDGRAVRGLLKGLGNRAQQKGTP